MFNRTLSRENLKLAAVAAVSILVSTTGPAIARAAYDAANADKIDGKHAVGASSSVSSRKGDLVATSKITGRLPNDIIKKAPDANKLDGVDSSAYRFLSLDVYSVYPSGNSFVSEGFGASSGLIIPSDQTSGFDAGFVVPPDLKGDTLQLHVQWHTYTTSCLVDLSPNFVGVGTAGQTVHVGPSATSGMSDPDPQLSPPISHGYVETVFTLSSPDPGWTLQPFDTFLFGIYRPLDNCPLEVVVSGLWLTY